MLRIKALKRILGQAARTYLERSFEQFGDADLDALIKHGLTALSASVQVIIFVIGILVIRKLES